MKVLTIPQNYSLALEEMSLQERLKTEGIGQKIKYKLIGATGVGIGRNTFDKSDIDQKIVDKLLLQKKLLQTLIDWFWLNDYDALATVVKYRSLLTSITGVPKIDTVYRGFSPNRPQQAMGLAFKRKWFFKTEPDFKVGDTLDFIPDKLISFTTFEDTAKNFGKIIVSAKMRDLANSCISIDANVLEAMRIHSGGDDEKWSLTENEILFIPNGKAIKIKVESIG